MTTSHEHLPNPEQIRTLLRNLQVHAPRLLYHAVQRLKPAMTSDLDPFQVQDHTEGLVAALREQLASSWTQFEELIQTTKQSSQKSQDEQESRLLIFAEELDNLQQHIASSHGEASLQLLGWSGPFPRSFLGISRSLEEALKRIRAPGFSLPSPPYDYLPGWSPRGLESLLLRFHKRLKAMLPPDTQPCAEDTKVQEKTNPFRLYHAAQSLLKALAYLAEEEFSLQVRSTPSPKAQQDPKRPNHKGEAKQPNEQAILETSVGKKREVVGTTSIKASLTQQSSGGDVFGGNSTIMVIR